jgi:hypothetical protein
MTTKYFQPALPPRSAAARRAAAARWIQRAVEMLTADADETRSAPIVDGQAASIRTFCCDCGDDFTISAGQREWLTAKGLSLFKRCEPCRKARKAETRASR